VWMGARRDSGRAGRRRLIVWSASIAWVVAMLALMVSLEASQAGSRRAVAQRLAARTSAGAQFASLYVRDILARENNQAARWLSGRRPTLQDLEHASGAVGVSASVLLDRQGRVLEVVPAKRALLGKVITRKYSHLAAAAAGRAAVSNVVPSASRGVPVVAFAVPFATRSGRRVFSGAFSVSETPLGAYLSRVVVIPGRRVYLVDAQGSLIAGSEQAAPGAQTLTQLDSRLARRAGTRTAGAYTGPHGGQTFVTSAVAGTPWRLVAAVPDAELYNALDGPIKWLAWVAVASLAFAGLIVIMIGSRLMRSRERLETLNGDLDRLARVDSLTGVRNRRDLEETLAAAVSSAQRHRSALSVLMIDIDHFKHVNDSLGHQAGDAVLVATALSIQSSLRTEDTVGRWGGEEFLVVLPETDAQGALLVAERVRAQVAASASEGAELPAPLTVTIGVAVWRSGGIDDLIRGADEALYSGKVQGRDNVSLAPARPARIDLALR
jgi:diguanylate cyclase (GGDEF)-like protein